MFLQTAKTAFKTIITPIQEVVDNFFIDRLCSYKRSQRIRANSYYFLCGLVMFSTSELIYRQSPWYMNIVVLCTIFVRLALLKFQKFKVFNIVETFVFCTYPIVWSTPIENLLRGCVLPLVLPIILYFCMLPLQYIFIIVSTHLFAMYHFRTTVLEIFNSDNNALKTIMIQNMFQGMTYFLAAACVAFMFSRLQFNSITKDTKRLLNESQATNQKLTETVKLLESTNKELEASKKQLEEALKAKDLLATVSHELRNPLNALLGNVDLLLEEVTNKEHIQKLEVAKMCGDTLLCLINNLLDAAKIASDKLEVSLAPVNMYQFFEKVWRINSVVVRKKNLVGGICISRTLPKFLMVDSHRILQILMNMISNAVKFTEKGSVKILVSWVHKNDISDPKSMPNFQNSPTNNSKILKQISLSDQIPKFDDRLPCIKLPNTDRINIDRKIISKQQTGELSASSSLNFTETQDDQVDWVNTPTQLSPKFIKDVFTEKYLIFNSDDLNIAEVLNKNSNTLKKVCDLQSKNQGYLQIEVIDTGCGIAKDAQEKLFTPFTQEDASITRKYGGTGLGLYIIKNLVIKMNGHMIFESEKNVGTRFVTQIPSETTDQLPDFIRSYSGITPKVSRNYPGCVALIVEDNEYNQVILKTFMQKLGINTFICDDGKQGYELYKSKPSGYFSFITMDLQMPIMDGVTSCTLIREYEKKAGITSQVPIVIVTGNCSEIEKNICMNPVGHVKASFFYRKPLTIADCGHFVSVIMKKNPNSNSSKSNKTETISVQKNPRFLVVDDDPLSMNILCQYLKNKSIDYDQARHGLEAFEKVKADSGRYDGVLMDCEMPVMNGIDASENIKAFLKQENKRDLPIYGLTGHADSEYDAKLKRVGMCRVFHKPVNFVDLVVFLLKSVEGEQCRF